MTHTSIEQQIAEALTERVREMESKEQRVPLTESAIQQDSYF